MAFPIPQRPMQKLPVPQQRAATPQSVPQAATPMPTAVPPPAAAPPAPSPASQRIAQAATGQAPHSMTPMQVAPSMSTAAPTAPMSVGAYNAAQQAARAKAFSTGAPGAAGAPPGGMADPDFQGQANKTWADMLGQSNSAEQGALQSTYSDEALNERRAAEQNASMGGGVGGGFSGGQAQAQLGGTQQRLGVRSDYANKQLNMKGAYLQSLIKQAEASKDRNLQRELQAELDKTNLQIQQMGADQQSKDTQAQADIAKQQADEQAYESKHGIIQDALNGGILDFTGKNGWLTGLGNSVGGAFDSLF